LLDESKTVATSRGHIRPRGHAAGNDGAAITFGDALANFPGRADDIWCSTGLTRFLSSDEPVRGMSMSKDPADPWVKREASQTLLGNGLSSPCTENKTICLYR
jgi:hypothetical protein